ncbi:hypothetical protein LEMLEM_LOCUS23081 [Lemmus lemmus]
MILVLVVTLAVFLLYCWQQKNQLGTDIDRMDMSPHQKLEPSPDRQSQSAPEDFQDLHLEPGRQQEEDLPLQPPYYDLGVSPSYRPLVRLAKPRHSATAQLPAPKSSCLRGKENRQTNEMLGWE